MSITPGPGYMVDPDNQNGVIPIPVNPNNYAGTPVPGEPAVISSAAGADAFQTKVQPAITAANANVASAQDKKNSYQTGSGNQMLTDKEAVAQGLIPPDVQAEIDAGKDPVELATEKQQAQWDKETQDAKDRASQLSLAQSAAAQAQIGGLTNAWQQRRALLEQQNKAGVANWNQQFIRSGQAEYSPGMTGDMITQKENEGLSKLTDLDNDYNAKVAEINTALSNNQFSAAASLTQELNRIQDEALSLMRDNAKAAKAVNDQIQAQTTQASRDSAIANLVQQGVTDPADILGLLNTKQGSSAGGDFTADEVGKALKILLPDDALSGVSGDYKTYKYLQDQNDPSVAGLDYYGFLAAVGNAQRKATVTDEGGGTPIPWNEYLAAAQQEMGMSINPDSDTYKQLRAQYDQGTVSLGKVTPTEKSALARADLANADTAVQTYFLSTQPAFQDTYTRSVASGDAGEPTLDALHQAYEDWTAQQEGSSSASIDTLVKALSE